MLSKASLRDVYSYKRHTYNRRLHLAGGGKHLLILLEGALQEAYRLFFASSQGVEPLAGGATTAAIGASRTPDIPAMR